jgi:DNA-directed RNA polymerase specialized sigma24 family protein
MLETTARTSETFSAENINGIGLLGWLRKVIDRHLTQQNLKSLQTQFATEMVRTTRMTGTGGHHMLNWKEFKTAVEQLPQDNRVVFGLHDIYGYKHEEIADRLGISINVSKSHLHDARLKLRTLLLQN